MRKFLLATFAGALVSCGQATDTDATKVDASQAGGAESPKAAAASGGDPCTLVSDPEAVFGTAVSVNVKTMPNGSRMCVWQSAEGRTCGTVTVLGPGWSELLDVPRNYAGMVTSLGAFGSPKELAGVGEEAQIVDGGILGVQIAFRTSKAAVNVGAGCGENTEARVAMAERLARAVAAKL